MNKSTAYKIIVTVLTPVALFSLYYLSNFFTPTNYDSENIEVGNYSFEWLVHYESDMLLSQDDLRFTNSTETSLP